MGVRISTDEDKAALFDSVTGWAFGPVFDSSDDATEFLDYLDERKSADARSLSEAELSEVHSQWHAWRESQS